MPAPFSVRSPRWLHAGLIVLLGVLATGLLFQRWSWGAWGRPHWLDGDPLEVYLRVAIAGEQPGRALLHFNAVDRLGAPTGADWSAYPVPDRLVFVLTGLLARAAGLFTAINLVVAFFTGLNAASFYLCARWLRCRWEWALGLGLVFAFCNYNVRWGITLSLAQTFTLPPLVLLCAWAGRRGRNAGNVRGWLFLAAGLALWLGFGNPYLTWFAGVVAGGTLLLALLRRNSWTRKIPLLVFLGCLTVSFLGANAGSIGQRLRGEAGNTFSRHASDFQVYALRPVDWFIPPDGHRVPALANIGAEYIAARHANGEFFYNYLGVLGTAGLLGLLAASAWHLLRQRYRKLEPLLGLGWICAFGAAGGINAWLGAAGFDLFRASTRIGIFAVIWVLFFLAGWITRRSRRWPRVLSMVVAAVIALAACWEQTPPFEDDPVVGNRNLARWRLYENITARLERELSPGAAVFQLPAVPFPEAGPTLGMTDYEHALPFLTTRALRFSYGHLPHAPALAWVRHGSRLPAADMVAALEKAGFSALWIDRRAFTDRGESLAASLMALGRVELPTPDASFPVRIFRLQPSSQPQVPDYADPRLKERWFDASDSAGQPVVLVLDGWYPPEKSATTTWRWAKREATLGIWWGGTDAPAKVRFRLNGPSTVSLWQNGRELKTLHPGPELQELEIHLAHGLNTLAWRLNGPTFRPGGSDPRELGFMVENPSVSVP